MKAINALVLAKTPALFQAFGQVMQAKRDVKFYAAMLPQFVGLGGHGGLSWHFGPQIPQIAPSVRIPVVPLHRPRGPHPLDGQPLV